MSVPARSSAETISGRLASFAVALRYDELPADMRKLARLVLLDTIGHAVAGWSAAAAACAKSRRPRLAKSAEDAALKQ
jgi:2-methylcitrate dehydratase PrpD